MRISDLPKHADLVLEPFPLTTEYTRGKKLREVVSDVLRPESTEFEGIWIFKRAKAK